MTKLFFASIAREFFKKVVKIIQRFVGVAISTYFSICQTDRMGQTHLATAAFTINHGFYLCC